MAAILAQHPENRVIGIDRDAQALRIARQQLEPFGSRVELYHERFEHVQEIMQLAKLASGADNRTPCFDGILLDLGMSSLQLNSAERGFSFQQAARLDMRMDQREPDEIPLQSAYEVVNTYSYEDLADVIFQYGEERNARRIAKRIVEARSSQPIETTTELAEIIIRAIPKRFHPKGIHPATRVFQAIRIEVNDELRRLGDTLEDVFQYLRPGGRMCVISFHSLEDRIVKRTFVKLAKGCQCPPDFPECVCGKYPILKIICRKPVTASVAEQAQNLRSRSAKLRIAQKLEERE